MVRLPRALEEKRAKLLALAQRRAFESYMRFGHVPELHKRAAAFAIGAEKALGSGVELVALYNMLQRLAPISVALMFLLLPSRPGLTARKSMRHRRWLLP